jgi:type IV pilus assembly protein PilC
MPIFHYKTIDKEGKKMEGTIESKDKFSLYHSLKKDDNTIISAEEVGEGDNFSFMKLFSFLNGVSMRNKIVFARNLSQMIEAGLPITRGLSIMERQTRGKFKTILGELNESISKGNSLSDSMKKYPDVFSTLFVSMARAGEESGNLSMALKNIGLQMEKTYQLTKKIRGALMYPAVIFSLMIVIGFLMMVFMVPTLTATFTGLGLKLPLATRIIIGTSNFLQSYFIFVILGAIVSAFLIAAGLRTKRGQRAIDIFIIHMPVLNDIVRQINSARTTRTLSSLLSSGVDIVVAIGITKDVIQNSYYKEVLDKIQISIQKGEQISTIFLANENLYPLFVGEMVSVGEETGKIGEMLSNVATFYEDEVDQKTKDMSSVIEPFLMIFIGLAVGLFAIAIIGPMYSLADSI